MENKNPKGTTKVAKFFKKNIYYILMAICVAVIITLITVAAVTSKKPNLEVNNPVEDPPVVKPVDPVPTPIFMMSKPIDGAKVGLDYVDSELVYLKTLNEYRVHQGVDFLAESGANVKSVFDGVVESVETDNLLYGTVIRIKHMNGFVSVYKSVTEPVVTVGQSVSKNQVIAKVSNTAIIEEAEGPHLHFE
ncbi:MAG: M23 family metallopeptidase, partial [Clostridia bacterium]